MRICLCSRYGFIKAESLYERDSGIFEIYAEVVDARPPVLPSKLLLPHRDVAGAVLKEIPHVNDHRMRYEVGVADVKKFAIHEGETTLHFLARLLTVLDDDGKERVLLRVGMMGKIHCSDGTIDKGCVMVFDPGHQIHIGLGIACGSGKVRSLSSVLLAL